MKHVLLSFARFGNFGNVKQVLGLVIFLIVLSGCEKEPRECQVIWQFDRNQVSASAKVDSSTLRLEVWNPTTPNAIQLSQEYLQGDFELSIDLIELVPDTLLTPQFRFEVYDVAQPESSLSGIAVHPNVFYCYVNGIASENRDDRLIPTATGNLSIKRENGFIACSAEIGGVELEYTDTIGQMEMGVRLVFGATDVTSGQIYVILDEFKVWQDWPNATTQGASTSWDGFDCQSW